MFFELLIDNLDKKLVNRLVKSNLRGVDSFIVSDKINIKDINKVCGYEVDVNNFKFDNKYMYDLLYLYFVRTKNKNNIRLVMEYLGYKYSIDDVLLLDKYVSSRKCKDNDLVFKSISKIWSSLVDEDDSLFKTEIKKMYKFKKIFDDEVLPFELINNFVKVSKCSNFYFYLKEVEKVMTSSNDLDFKKKMLIVFNTYNFVIDNNLMNNLFDIKIDKNDIINFINELESNNIYINDKQLKNMLSNFRCNYLMDCDLFSNYNELCDKVVKEYSLYYSNHFYFRESDFIKYYNEKYNDDFSCFVLKKNKVLLNEEILGSIFNKYSLLGDYFLFRGDVNTYNIFKDVEKNSCKYLRDQEERFKERKKFYRKYKTKVNKYILLSDEMCFKYFINKYIDKNDRVEFYELFKTIYRDNYVSLETKKGSLNNSAILLKKDFVDEVLNNSFSDRYKIRDKYLELADLIGCSSYIKSNYYDVILEELERKYKLLLSKEILVRLENSKDKKNLYKELEVYIENELGYKTMDDLFLSFPKKHNDIKEKYFNIKKSINSKCKVKKKKV